MEPPSKRLRLSQPDSSGPKTTVADTVEEYVSNQPGTIDLQNERPIVAKPRPTRTLDLSSFRRRSLERQGLQPKGNAGIYLLPRAPGVTVTANVLNIAIMEGTDQTSTTEMPAPTTDTEISISDLGTLTVQGLAPVTSTLNSLTSSVTKSLSPTESSESSSTGSLISSTLSVNSTSDDRTMTVTSTSTLSISFSNGTAFHTSTITSSSSYSVSTTVTDDPASTTESGDESRTDSPTSYVFGDLPTSTTTQPYSDGTVNGIAATSTSSSPSSTPTPTDNSSGGGVVLTPQQQQVVGGVVGGVAGVALVLVALLYFLKWYRRHLKAQGRLPEQMVQHRQLPSADDYEYRPSGEMTQPLRSSIQPIAAFKQSLQRFRPNSLLTTASVSTERSSFPGADSERSFQRVSGRKIPSVLLTGGDGYGNSGPASPPSEHSSYSRSRDASQTSSFRESNNSTSPFLVPAFVNTNSEHNMLTRHQTSTADSSNGGPSSAGLASTAAGDFANLDSSRSQLNLRTGGLAALNPIRKSDMNVTVRPSPARTPTTTSPASSSLILPMNTPPLMSGDIPEVPPLTSKPIHANPRKTGEGRLDVQRSMGPRSTSGFSARSSGSVGGKFTEEI